MIQSRSSEHFIFRNTFRLLINLYKESIYTHIISNCVSDRRTKQNATNVFTSFNVDLLWFVSLWFLTISVDSYYSFTHVRQVLSTGASEVTLTKKKKN